MGLFRHVRRHVVGGLLLLLPLLITLWLLALLYGAVQRWLTPWVLALLRWGGVPGLGGWATDRVLAPVIGLLLTGSLVYLIGLAGRNLAARRVGALVERTILRVPLVRGIYGAARQLLQAFRVSGSRAFSKVVLLEYPRRRLWTVGFVTSEEQHRLSGADARDSATVAVFLPTTPNPTSGWMLLVPKDDLFVLDMTIEQGIKLVVSGGIVSPGDLGQRARPWEAAEVTPAAVAARMVSAGRTLATAESCTAGMLGAALTAAPGASEWYRGGVVVYSDDLKRSLAGVREGTLRAQGAVSPEVARELAAGVRERCGADFGLGITGVAGPTGGTADKPVGRVYLALAGPEGTEERRLDLTGGREGIRRGTVRAAMEVLLHATAPRGRREAR